MIDYPTIIRTYIASGSYVLEQLEERIDTLWVEGKLTDDDRAELLALAAENARDVFQTDVLERLAKVEHDVWELQHPVEQYEIWKPGKVTAKGEIVRFDVTGDDEYDLCRYDGGRASTSLSIGKIEGWHLLSRELEVVATITRDADGGYVITPIPEPEPADEGEPVEPVDDPNATEGE